MKKLSLLSLAVFGTAVTLPMVCAPAALAVSTVPTYVTGQVTHNKIPVVNAAVTVVCEGHTQNAEPTNEDGTYAVKFSNEDCSNGEKATAHATSADLSGSGAGTVHDYAVLGVNIALVQVALVPEFSVVTGMAGLLAGAGALYYIRSRQGASA